MRATTVAFGSCFSWPPHRHLLHRIKRNIGYQGTTPSGREACSARTDNHEAVSTHPILTRLTVAPIECNPVKFVLPAASIRAVLEGRHVHVAFLFFRSEP